MVFDTFVGEIMRWIALAASVFIWALLYWKRLDWVIGAAWIMVIHMLLATTLYPWYLLLPTFLAVASQWRMMLAWWRCALARS